MVRTQEVSTAVLLRLQVCENVGGLCFPTVLRRVLPSFARVLKPKGILHSFLLCFSPYSIAKKVTDKFLRFSVYHVAAPHTNDISEDETIMLHVQFKFFWFI
jgi:hypothetical protein